MKILIVDDSRVMRQIVARTLRQAGFGEHDTVEAADGQAAVAAVQAHRPGLVVSDWNMPVMNGLELLVALRAGGDAVPLGFVTSECTDEMRSAAAGAGAQFFVVKPFSADVFRDVLGPILG